MRVNNIYMRLIISIVILAGLLSQARCLSSDQESTAVPAWQKICASVGLALVAIALLVYKLRNRNLALLRQYISPGQSEITFINFKSRSDSQVQEMA